MAPCIIAPHKLSSAQAFTVADRESGKKAILCLVYGLSLSDTYQQRNILCFETSVTVADRKLDRVFHFPVAIFTYKLNKDPFATRPRLHLPTIHIAKGRRQLCNQECNLHHEFHIHGKC